MNNISHIFDDLLYNNLMPWLKKNVTDKTFNTTLNEYEDIKPVFTQKYRLNFYKPFNQKTIFYRRIITNETNFYCNKIYYLINNENNELQKYWFENTVNKKIHTKLISINRELKEKHYLVEYVNPKKVFYYDDMKSKTDNYIAQFLKISLVKANLEIQSFLDPKKNENLLKINDLYTPFFQQKRSKKLFIKKIKKNSSQKKITPHISADKLHSFTYKYFNSHNSKLTDLCDSLKKNNLITKETTVINFKKVFSGKEINSPIQWTGNKSEFYYFIYLIYTKYQLVEDLKQQQWKIACNCFVHHNKPPFERDKIKKLSIPKKTRHIIENTIDLLM